MSVHTIVLKTHSREEVTEQCGELNNCIVHGVKPHIFRMVVGRCKEVYFTANCEHDDCGKIGQTKEEVTAHWNKWNQK